MERSKDPAFGLIGKRLRAELEDADQPLPERWIDLIRHLDEQERRKSCATASEPSRQIGTEVNLWNMLSAANATDHTCREALIFG